LGVAIVPVVAYSTGTGFFGDAFSPSDFGAIGIYPPLNATYRGRPSQSAQSAQFPSLHRLPCSASAGLGMVLRRA